MKLIDKDALVAEIERLKECNRKICAGDFDFLRKTYPEHYYSTEIYNSILSFLDTLEVIEIGVDLGDPKGDKSAEYIIDTKTLEVKEVDLDKAIDDYIYTHDGRKRLALELDWKYCNLTLKGGNEIIKFAKHFFELGLNAQCKISYVPNIDDSLEELGVDPTSKEAKILKESYYIALEKLKAQKGE